MLRQNRLNYRAIKAGPAEVTRLGRSPAAVAELLHRGLKQLREQMDVGE